MTSWQRRTRRAIAVAGVAVAGIVYAGLREREPRPPSARVERLDPAAVFETTAASLQHVEGDEIQFEVSAARTLSYQDGSTRQFDVRITAHRGESQTYVITAQQAEAGRDRIELQLTGDVVVAASDGLRLQTAHASFNQDDGVVRAPGEVTFEKGRLVGSGIGMQYDEARDLLEVSRRSQVRMSDEDGRTVMAFSAVSATLDRLDDRLALAGDVRATRDTQTIEAERGDAHLTPAHDAITFIALRGRARVAGGRGSPGAMQAHEIDLHYDATGETLERADLRRDASLVLAEGDEGRRLGGDMLDLRLSPDGTLREARGAGNVRLELPADPGGSPGTVHAETLAATGAPGAGLTEARFDGGVEYAETGGGDGRRARARRLDAQLADGRIGRAVFTTDVVFEGDGYRATAGRASYEPDRGRLELRRGDRREAPRVEDARLTIDAETIDLSLDAQRIHARTAVRTLFTAGADPDARMPGLLETDAPAHVAAEALDYDGAAARARYEGDAVLWQRETTLRADRIEIDQQRGNLLAAGGARSTMALEDGRLDGRAHEIRYDEAGRLLILTAAADTPAGGADGRAHLVGPAGDLRAMRIAVRLLADGGMEGIDAARDVRVDTDGRVATGGALAYRTAEERYELTGTPDVPVRVADACGDTAGRTLIFFASADRMIVDGHEQVRTRTTSHGSCRGGRSR